MSKKKSKLNSEMFHKDRITLHSLELTAKQKKLLGIALDAESQIIFVTGPAGSSKTYISVYSALRLLSQNQELDLIYVRTIIESAEKGLGALPGDLNDKFNPYMIPLEEKLYEILPKNTTTKKDLFASGRIEAMPINFLRGVDWKNKIVIMDEAQNATFKELTTLITRLGENSKLFICGDMMQSDINGKSGFGEMIKTFSDQGSVEKGIHTFEFFERDIKRSEILKYIIKKLTKRQDEGRGSN
jgi:phosphate starvation-inducible PhoH-like protein